MLDVPLNQFIEWQKGEPAFRHAWETVVLEAENNNPCQGDIFLVREGLFVVSGNILIREGLLYPGMAEQPGPLQLLIPHQLRPLVRCLSHDIPLAGHLRVENQRVLQWFY